MSKNPKPTVEELRCIYDLILRGYDDADILAEYASLYDNGNLMFPYRTDKRFIRQCRRELEAALAVAQKHIEKHIDPVNTKRREDHFADLADVANRLLGDNLKRVMKWVNAKGDFEYHLYEGDCNSETLHRLTEYDLAGYFEKNTISAYYDYTEWFFKNCFLPHLYAEWPDDLKNKGFYIIAEEQPYKLIETLRLLAERKTFKGSCPVCKDW